MASGLQLSEIQFMRALLLDGSLLLARHNPGDGMGRTDIGWIRSLMIGFVE